VGEEGCFTKEEEKVRGLTRECLYIFEAGDDLLMSLVFKYRPQAAVIPVSPSHEPISSPR
jgi:hypothetical protein